MEEMTSQVPVISRPEYKVFYELGAEGRILVHVQVFAWNHRVARRFRKDIDAAHELLGESVFAVFDPDNSRRRFFTKHGFRRVGIVSDLFGRPAALYERSPPNGR